MKFLTTLLLTLICITLSWGQNIREEFTYPLGGASLEYGTSMALDTFGNLYSIGHFHNTVDFDPSSSIDNHSSNGLWDIYIQKYDVQGNYLWTKTIGGTTGDYADGIAISPSGYIYITGSFTGNVDFDPNIGSNNLSSAGDRDIFILKMDLNGNLVWSKRLGGSGFDTGTSLTLDQQENIYLTGYFQNTVDFDPSNTTYNLSSNGGFDYFIQKLDNNGQFLWAQAIGGASVDKTYMVDLDQHNNILIAGYFNGNVDFDPSLGTQQLSSNGLAEAFIQKLDSMGNFQWVVPVGGSGNDVGYAVSTDINNNVLFTGYFQYTVDFDPSSNIYNLSSNGLPDVFLQKLNGNGQLLWAKSWGGQGQDQGLSICTDSLGNSYVGGFISSTASFDYNVGSWSLDSEGAQDIFLTKVDPNGELLWAKSWGGTGNDRIRTVIQDNDFLYCTGYFHNTVDFDPNTGTKLATSNGSQDCFIQKYSQCDVDIRTFYVTDSIGPFHITDAIAAFDTTATANYQWLDYSNNYAPITGETNSMFYPLGSQSYALAISNNGCIDTSHCIPFIITSIPKTKNFDNKIRVAISPNPTGRTLSIQLSKNEPTQIILYTISGEVLLQKFIDTSSTILDLTDYPAGLYFITLQNASGNYNQKIIKH
ncbi:MAG: T9SS type A sorting domain-containing protein [Aureispira sp.]|nr:T9SS type A sorting domain-containing protein [Aureispira sp.]